MKKFAALFICLGCCLGAAIVLAQPASGGFKRYNVKNGLSNSSVWAIAQDKSGFMWFGTFDGLNRYDGYQFKVFKHNPNDSTSLPGNFINSLYTDRKGRLWVGTFDGLGLYDPAQENFRKYVPQVKDGIGISQVIEDLQGNLLVGTWSGLNRFNETTQKLETYLPDGKKNALTDAWANVLLVEKNGNLWVGLGEKGLLLYEGPNRQLQVFQFQENDPYSLSNNRIECLFQDSKGQVWVGTQQGLCRYEGQGRFKQFLANPGALANLDRPLTQLVDGRIMAISEDKAGDVWIATQNGLHRYHASSQLFSYYQHDPDDPESISGNAPRRLFFDRFGHLWASGFGGLDKLVLHRKPFQKIKRQPTKANTLISNDILSFAQEPGGRLWIGTNKGVSGWDSTTQSFTNLNIQSGLAGEVISHLVADRHHNLWFKPNGVMVTHRYNTRQKKLYSYTDLFRDKEGKMVNVGLNTLTANGDFLFFNSVGQCFIHDPATDTFLPHDLHPGYRPPGEVVRFYEHDHLGRAWWLSGSYLSMWDGKNKRPQKIDSLTIDGKRHALRNLLQVYACLFSDQADTVWVSTSLGLAKVSLATRQARLYTQKDGLATTLITSIRKDRQNRYWVASNAGLFRLDPGRQDFVQYTEADGLPSTQLINNASYQAADGSLYYGTQNGFTHFAPEAVQDRRFVPPAVLTDLQLFNRPVRPGDESGVLATTISQTKRVELTHEQSVLGLEYASLNYTLPEKVQYAYKLEGFDPDWNYVNHRRLATYTNLPRGREFVFKLKTTNEDGIWGEPQALLEIYVAPPWWETWWFRTLAGGALLLAAYWFYRTRTQYLEAQNQKLEAKVEERTREVVKKGRELEEANLEVRAKNEELLATEEELRQNMEELEANKETLEQTLQVVQAKGKVITDSIRYAQTIQSAILPHPHELQGPLADHFVLFKPKDVVSGDFYWAHQADTPSGPAHWLAVVDCTGHGVPGAFMSLIGHSILNEVVGQGGETQPDQVLALLDERVRLALKQTGSGLAGNVDGMDLGLVRLQRPHPGGPAQLDFAGARRPLWYVRAGTGRVQVLPGARKGVGGGLGKADQSEFDVQHLELQPGDRFYLFSDGLPDQPDPQRRKFGTERLRNLLAQNQDLRLPQQRELLEATLAEHQTSTPQRDDVSMVGWEV
jgi:ligand-binding sensor domain-containing protein/serine phosphatase RsbU (regulator of sigma subunit)